LPCKKITEFSKLHAAFQELLNTEETYGWLKAAFKAFSKHFHKKFTSYNSFANAITNARQNGIESVVIDKRLFKDEVRIYDPKIYYWLHHCTSSPKKLTCIEIHSHIIEACKEAGIDKVPGFEWVKKHRARVLKTNNEIYSSRYGQTEAFNKNDPYAKIIHALNANSVWQIDGWVLPFVAEGYVKFILFVIRDSYSKKIVGYSFGRSENTNLILDALNDAVRNTDYLPYEIVSDNSSFNKTKEAEHLKDQLNQFGVKWTVSQNPRYKSIAERYFRHLGEKHCKQYPGYIGQGIKTRDINGRPAQELLDQYQKAGYWRTPDEIKLIGIAAIDDFNKTINHKIGKSPNQLYSESEMPHAFKVSLFDRIRIFTKCTKCKVQRGQINITRAGILHEFQLNADLMHKYNGQEVLVRYENLSEGIYLYDLKTDTTIGEVKPKQSIHGALADQTEADKEKLLKNKGRLKGYKTKARKDNEKAVNPEAYEIINRITTPKDVLKQIEQDYNLRNRAEELGIDLNNVETGKPVNEFPLNSLKPKKPKEEKSPILAKTDREIRIINPEDY
jgi:transposase InsO family protein